MASTGPNFSDAMLWNSRFEVELTDRESAMEKIRKIVVWENPLVSLLYFMGVNILFWFLMYGELRFYGLVFMALLILSLIQMWNDHLQLQDSSPEHRLRFHAASPRNPASHTSIFSFAEMNNFLSNCFKVTKNVCRQLSNFRKEHPGMFCVTISMLFAMLGVNGKTFPNVALLYVVALMIMTVPGIVIHMLPHGILEYLEDMTGTGHNEDIERVNEEEEYLPDTDGETLELLRMAGDLDLADENSDDNYEDDFMLEQMTTRTNDTNESICSRHSLFTEFCTSFGDDRLSCHDYELSEENLVSRMDYSDDSEESMDLWNRYFNGDTSDEEDPSSELRFTEDNKEEADCQPEPENESSSDTDSFELISEEEM